MKLTSKIVWYMVAMVTNTNYNMLKSAEESGEEKM